MTYFGLYGNAPFSKNEKRVSEYMLDFQERASDDKNAGYRTDLLAPFSFCNKMMYGIRHNEFSLFSMPVFRRTSQNQSIDMPALSPALPLKH